jgi:integrase
MAYIAKIKSQSGQPRFRAFIRRKGHRTVTKVFRLKSHAERWARKTEAAIEEGLNFPTAEARRRTTLELIERYIEKVVPERPQRDQPRLTKQLQWWSQRIGAVFLADLRPADIAKHRDALIEGRDPDRKQVAPATANRYLAVLSHACTLAVKEWGWLEDNPALKVRRMKEPAGRVRYLSDEERSRLLDACKQSHDPRLYPLVLMAVCTGARQGELLALGWSDIDFDRGYAVIQSSKNGERRSLSIVEPLLGILKEMVEARRTDSDLIFAGRAGTVHFPKKPWQKALEVAQVEDFTFHDLRHSAASYLAMSGATLAEIAAVLGHRTLAMVKRYSHLSEQHTAEVVARMNRRILGI